MAKLNANAMRCNVLANDIVVAGRMGIDAQLAVRAAALLSQGSPAHAGTEPTPMTRGERALVESDYRDATATRTGRSAVSPCAGGFAPPHARPGHAGTAIATRRWSLAKQQRDVMKRLFAASATRRSDR